MQHDYIVFIGKFQPPHLAHIQIIREALKQSDWVIILVGSAGQPRTVRNPFTWQERREMLLTSLPSELANRILVRPLFDKLYSDQAWVRQVQENVAAITEPTKKVGIIGHTKDDSSYYLKMFPQWSMIDIGTIEDIHATDIRDAMYNANDVGEFAVKTRTLPREIFDWIQAFMLRPEFDQLVREYNFIQKYKSAWDCAPYAPTFVTVDAVVIQSGHVLLVRRRAEPGAGTTAIVGGFVNQDERLEDAMIRELREETNLKVPEPVLRGSIKATFVADHPERSLRGRTISHVFGIHLNNTGSLPKVKGGSDASKAFWVPLSTFKHMEDQMFEDHYHLVNILINKMT